MSAPRTDLGKHGARVVMSPVCGKVANLLEYGEMQMSGVDKDRAAPAGADGNDIVREIRNCH